MNKFNDLKCALAVIDRYIQIVYDNEESFLDKFTDMRGYDLTSITFDQEFVRIVYIIECGQHVVDSIYITSFIEWMKANDFS